MGAYLDFVYIADSVIKLNRATTFHICWVSRTAIGCTRAGSRQWSVGIPCIWSARRACISLHLGRIALLMVSWAFKRAALGCCLDEQVCAILHWSTKGSLWALNIVLRPLLPLVTTLREQWLAASNSKSMPFRLGSPSSDGLDCGSHRGSDSDSIRVVAGSALNSISRGQKCIEALDQIWVASEQLRNTVNDAGCINSKCMSASESYKNADELHTPGF